MDSVARHEASIRPIVFRISIRVRGVRIAVPVAKKFVHQQRKELRRRFASDSPSVERLEIQLSVVALTKCRETKVRRELRAATDEQKSRLEMTE